MKELLDAFWRAAADCLHPRVIVLSLLLVALLMAPALVSLVTRRRFADLQARRGAALWQSLLWSLGSTLVALAALQRLRLQVIAAAAPTPPVVAPALLPPAL